MTTHRLNPGLAARAAALLLAAAAVVAALVAPPARAQHAGHAASAPGMSASGASAAPVRKRPPPLAMGAAVAPDGALWLVALDAQQRLYLQASRDEGRSWLPPQPLDTGSDKIAADGENRPKIAFGPRGWVVVTYTEPLSKPYTGRIRMLRSEDGGRSFSAPFTVHADQQLITHRFESVAFDAQGLLHTLWIDKRDLEALIAAAAVAPAASGGAVGRRARPVVDYRGAAVYRNVSADGGRSFGPDTKLADHSCECCRIALAPTPQGGLVALWRHVFEPNERDHAFAPLGPAGGVAPLRPVAVLPGAASAAVGSVAGPVAASARSSAPVVRATFDHWALDACPHHGPGLAPAAQGGYHAVWFGVRAGEGRVRYGRLKADGSPDGPALPLPDAAAEHAAVHSAGPRVAIAWRSFDGQATRWRAWLSADDGAHWALRELGRSTDDNDHPLLLAQGPRLYALWRTTQGVQVERLEP